MSSRYIIWVSRHRGPHYRSQCTVIVSSNFATSHTRYVEVPWMEENLHHLLNVPNSYTYINLRGLGSVSLNDCGSPKPFRWLPATPTDEASGAWASGNLGAQVVGLPRINMKPTKRALPRRRCFTAKLRELWSKLRKRGYIGSFGVPC